jgi:hypothetical protein
MDKLTQATIAINNPTHGLPKKYEPTAATKAAISILPSKLKSITPDRSANIPAIAAKTNGVEILSVELVIEAISDKNSIRPQPAY